MRKASSMTTRLIPSALFSETLPSESTCSNRRCSNECYGEVYECEVHDGGWVYKLSSSEVGPGRHVDCCQSGGTDADVHEVVGTFDRLRSRVAGVEPKRVFHDQHCDDNEHEAHTLFH